MMAAATNKKRPIWQCASVARGGLLLFVCVCIVAGCDAFLPSPRQPRRSSQSPLQAAIAPGDTVVVVGGTGGVGQLVTKKLQQRGSFTVRATCRDKTRGEETIDDPQVQVVELNLASDNENAATQLQAALKDAAAIVISVGTTAFPTQKWAGGNNPKAIDQDAVTRIAQAATSIPTMKKVVHLTSVGVDRTGEMPFLILNLFGVLDAKKAGEQAVKAAAASAGFDHVIVRPGRLVGGPFTNLDVARLLQVQGGAENGVDVASGDCLLGDCKRDACAEAVVQTLLNDACQNVDFSIVSNEEKAALTDGEWTATFESLRSKL